MILSDFPRLLDNEMDKLAFADHKDRLLYRDAANMGRRLTMQEYRDLHKNIREFYQFRHHLIAKLQLFSDGESKYLSEILERLEANLVNVGLVEKESKYL